MTSNDRGSNFDFLWNGSEKQWKQALSTPFVQGVKDGSLDAIEFVRYVVQDSIYLQKMYEVIKKAASKAEEGAMKDFLKLVTTKFKGHYEAAFNRLHINNSSAIKLDSACQAYIDFVENAAQNMDTIYFLVSMSPCLKLWAWLGTQIGTNHGAYNQWVASNFVSGSTLAGIIEFIDKEGEKFDRTKAMEVFKTGMEHEINFFNSVGKQ
ncbi:uncharacterized protein LOC110464623 [Mizuhopecten yessoensis]|uniref:Thiamine biosynthesis multifunctional protein ThiED n=1 Tax=Mizuhopecten yessoensis TaxID=6573 RepID=A0A210PTK0_MIZYE|nr:uncharacterized protein LOC110464623 [Mizuhopecten yessoensis]OWF39785.1 Thiamine biosynthesis multifunctional protein ThiED [Mizuhopecten yessoensis]